MSIENNSSTQRTPELVVILVILIQWDDKSTVIAKAVMGRQILFSVCAKFIDENTLNFTHEGKSLLS